MPNWCNNTLEMHFPEGIGKDKIELLSNPEKLESVLAKSCGLKESFSETTKEDGESFDRNDMINETGSKWYPFEKDTFENIKDMDDKETYISVYFDSAWSPPTELCLKLMNIMESTGKLTTMEHGCCIYEETNFERYGDAEIEYYTMSFEDDIEVSYLEGIEETLYECKTEEALKFIIENEGDECLACLSNSPELANTIKENEDALKLDSVGMD